MICQGHGTWYLKIMPLTILHFAVRNVPQENEDHKNVLLQPSSIPPQSQYDVMQTLKPQVVVNFPEIKFFNFIEIQKFVYFLFTILQMTVLIQPWDTSVEAGEPVVCSPLEEVNQYESRARPGSASTSGRAGPAVGTALDLTDSHNRDTSNCLISVLLPVSPAGRAWLDENMWHMSQLSHPASVDTANSSHNSAVLIIDVNKSPSSEQRNAPPCMSHLCLVMGNSMVTVCFYGLPGEPRGDCHHHWVLALTWNMSLYKQSAHSQSIQSVKCWIY